MSQTRKQWRKKQKEIKRRRRLDTRRQHQLKKQALENLKRENLMSQALGLTAMQGYNKNVLNQALSLSKLTRTNYYTEMAREKRVRSSLSRYLEDYNQERHTSPLHYAISQVDPIAVRLILEMGQNIQLGKKDIFDHTALEDVLLRLRATLENKIVGNIYGQSQMRAEMKKKREEEDKLINIVEILVDGGAPIGENELTAFWQTGPFIIYFLRKFPQLVPESYTNRNVIFGNLEYDVQDIIDQIRDEENNSGEYSGYSTVNPRLYDQLEVREYALATFRQFWNSYNPQTGKYKISNNTLSQDENENENE